MMRAYGSPALFDARCSPGQCTVLGIAYHVNKSGTPIHPIYPWWDNLPEVYR